MRFFVGLPATHGLLSTHKWVAQPALAPSDEGAVRAPARTEGEITELLILPLSSLPPSFCYAKIHLLDFAKRMSLRGRRGIKTFSLLAFRFCDFYSSLKLYPTTRLSRGFRLQKTVCCYTADRFAYFQFSGAIDTQPGLGLGKSFHPQVVM